MARFRVLIDISEINNAGKTIKPVWIFVTSKIKKIFDLKKLISERLNLSEKFNIFVNSEILLDHDGIENIKKGDIIKLQYEKNQKNGEIKNNDTKVNSKDLNLRSKNNKKEQPLPKRRKILRRNNQAVILNENSFDNHEDNQSTIIHSEPSTSSGIHLGHKAILNENSFDNHEDNQSTIIHSEPSTSSGIHLSHKAILSENSFDNHKDNQSTIIHSEPSTSSGIHLSHKSTNPKKLEAGFKQKEIYDDLVELNNIDLVSNKKFAECQVCAIIVGPEKGVVLKNCLHTFCRDCIQTAIEKYDAKEVRCPFSREYSCESLLQEQEIKSLTMPSENSFVQLPIIDSQPSTSSGKSLAHKSTNHKEHEDDFEQDKIYDNLIELNNMDLVSNKEPCECQVCTWMVPPEEGVILKNCLHTFCRDCMKDVIEGCDTRAEVKCPFNNGEYACESLLQELEIKNIAPEEYDRFLKENIILGEGQVKTATGEQFQVAASDNIVPIPTDALKITFDSRSASSEIPATVTNSSEYIDLTGDFLAFAPATDGPSSSNISLLAVHTNNDGTFTLAVKRPFDSESSASSKKPATMTKASEYIDLTGNSEQSPTSTIDHPGLSNNSLETETYKSLLHLNNLSLVPNKELFECPVCLTDVVPEEGVVLKECLHSFCKECLRGAIEHSFTVEIKCPFQNENYACDSSLQEQEIKSLVTSEMYESHLERSMKYAESQASNSFHCKTPDCPGWCLYEGDVNNFLCSVCNKNNCLTCAVIHEGRNCQQYQDFLQLSEGNAEAKKTWGKLKNMVKRGTAMHCPQCQVIVTKIEGCDYLTCSMCHTGICWITKGPRWGPGGKGDISGGCKCMLNGKKCHPKCKNCH